MKWYETIVTKFKSYKWYLFAACAIPFTWGFIATVLEGNAKIPTYIFLVELIILSAVWVPANIIYKKRNGSNRHTNK